MDCLMQLKLLLLLTILLCICDTATGGSSKLLIILIDGFRWDYFNKLGTKHPSGFNAIKSRGVKAEFMKPAFPSLSYPNYYTIVTGKSPAHHGIVNNEVYDKKHNELFSLNNKEDFLSESVRSIWYQDGEPIWITARKQGIDSHMFFMRACNAEVPFNALVKCDDPYGHPNITEFTDALLEAVNDLKTDKADLAAVYYSNVDHIGHEFGPESQEMLSELSEVDSSILQLDQALKVQKYRDRGPSMSDIINVVIVSDHGMTVVSEKQVVNLTQYLDMKDVAQTTAGLVVYGIWPKNGKLNKVYQDLTGKPHFSVYREQDIPDRWRYKGHPHTPTVTVVADIGYVLLSPDQATYPTLEGKSMTGEHGYDNDQKDMQAIFMAAGPYFKSKQTIPPIESQDLYNLFCTILGIHPAKNDGNMTHILPALSNVPTAKYYDGNTFVSFRSVIVTGLVAFASIGSVCLMSLIIYACRQRRQSKYRRLEEIDVHFEL